jgi:soluble lytic murein transglycosylase-like protein
MNPRLRFFLPVATLALGFMAEPAQAEIVVLTSGRTLNIKAHREEGDTIVLEMRSGGEVTCEKTLIEKIVADEVPFKDPQEVAVPAQEVVPGPAAEPSGLLQTSPYSQIIASMAETHGVDPVLVTALIQVESGNRASARSHKGAMGLMQLMPSTARQYNVRNPYDPRANIAAGVKHLKSLIDRFDGVVELALAAYNAGEGAVKKFNGIPPYRETRDYVSRILSLSGVR